MTNVVVHHLVATSLMATWHRIPHETCDGFRPQAVVWVRLRPLAFVGGRFHCTLLWALGAMWWLSSAALLCGGCGG